MNFLKKSLRIFFFCLLILLLITVPVNAQTLFTDTSSYASPPTAPGGGAASVNRSRGRKGFEVCFYRSDNLSSVDINAPAGAVSFSVNGTPKTVQANTLDPSTGNVGYQVVGGFDNGGGDTANNCLEIVYNSDLAPSDAIAFTISGLTSIVGGYPQDRNYTLNFNANASLLRSPTTIIPVLDVSGSMGWNIQGGAGTRLQALKRAMEIFLNTAKGYALLGDKLGVSYFTTTAAPLDLPPVGPPLLSSARIAGNLDAINSNIQGQNPQASTSIGDGLVKARDNLFSESPTGNTKYILLFSDGEQNTPPNVTAPLLSIDGTEYDPSIVKVCPVTLGDMTTPGNTLMNNIAVARCGGAGNNFHVLNSPVGGTPQETQLINFFTSILADVFVGDKLEISQEISGTIKPNENKVEKFLVNQKDVAMTLILSWSNPQVKSVPFKLKAPDGTLIDPSNSTILGSQNSVTTLTLPVLQNQKRIPQGGEWEIVFGGDVIGQRDSENLKNLLARDVEYPSQALVAQNSNNLTNIVQVPNEPSNEYHLLVMLDNRELATTYEVLGSDFGTGETIPVRVTLKENETPIVGATVTAQLSGPQQGIGDILSQQPTPSGTPNPNGDKFRSKAQEKLQLLVDNPDTAGLFTSQNLPTVSLFDNGSSQVGDAIANDGIYSTIFKNPSKEGYYNFTIGIVGAAPTNGKFLRTQTLSVFVRPKPSPNNTELTLLSSDPAEDGSVIIRLQATPRDALGNYIGPDYAPDYLSIKSSQGTAVAPIDDKLDGSYEISYQLPSAASNPNITVEVMGTSVVTKSLRELQGKFPLWLIILIIILVLILLALLIWLIFLRQRSMTTSNESEGGSDEQ
jgi:hypothetical protein